MNRDVLRFRLVNSFLKHQRGTCITPPIPGMRTMSAPMCAACLLVFGWVLISNEPARAAMLEAHTWQRWEHGLKSTREYGNPYADVTVTGQLCRPRWPHPSRLWLLGRRGYFPDSLRLPGSRCLAMGNRML